MDSISVAEFLEFEFYFELSDFLQIPVTQLKEYKERHRQEFAAAARHVLSTKCSPQCIKHIVDKKPDQQSRR